PEMYYGRFSANNSTELQPYIDKTLEYERHEFPDPSFLGEVVMIAGYDTGYAATYGNGQINYGTNHYFNAAHGILSHTYLYPESGSSDAQIIQNVSDGVGFINYTAHGGQTSWSDPTFTITNINGLSNDHEYCHAVGNCCLTSSFQVTTCFGEAWLRAPNKGAIGYIGASESTYWDEDYWFGVGYGPIVSGGATYEQTGLGSYDGMFHDHGEAIPQWYIVQDSHVFCGNLAVEEAGSSLTGYYWDIYNLMGDPSLSVYLGVPDANAITLPPNILPAATYVTVIAEPHSYVGFSADGVLLGGGMIDADGTSNIPISSVAAYSSVHVVVTCQNKIPYMVDLPVMTMEGPYLIVDQNDFNDYSGDQDGEVDAGENVILTTYLKNMGSDAATNVTGTLVEVRGVTISDDYETWGTINPDQTKPCDDNYNFVVSWDTPDQTQIDFVINISSSEDNWDRTFSLVIDAPIVEVIDVSIDDTAGNGDGMADPGETVGLTFHLANSGHEDCRNINGLISCASDYIDITDGSGSVANVPEGGDADLSGFSLTIDPACPEMISLDIALNMTASLGHQMFYNYPMPIAPFFDDFEIDLGWTVSSTATSGVWERADPQPTTYNGAPVQPGDDHTPAPGVNCWVTGPLAGSAAGTYDVDGGATVLTSTVADLSGLESATLEYWRWYTNNLGNGGGEDWWDVEVSDDNGANWVYLEHTQSSANQWTKMTFQLENFIEMTNQVIFRFTAADEGSGSLVEAAVDDFMLCGASSGSSGIDEPVAAAIGFRLWQNSPNAANPTTTIRYRLDAGKPVPTTLKIYDAMGRLVRTLVNEAQGAGNYSAVWDGRGDHGRSVSSGVFFYVLNSGENQQTRKMVVVQ
ncbi:MAG: T9SS type A sorting domain-containing protein, partial [Candidatus Eisenbacteria bacterium]|nr:T9SS type A sorting domain-containing protein [Candidatus Eisenbacteria bacterium]